jgi:hypothetical protein
MRELLVERLTLPGKLLQGSHLRRNARDANEAENEYQKYYIQDDDRA